MIAASCTTTCCKSF